MAFRERKTIAAVAVCVLATVTTAPALAGLAPPPDRRMAVELAAGVSGIFDDGPQPRRYGAEYFWRPVGRWDLTPGLGLDYADGGASFVFADLRKDFSLGPRWAVSVSLGGGLFHEDGGLHLGHEIEFRSGLALSHWFADRLRVGIGFLHLSNGGLSERNPGTEAVSLSILVPIGPEPAGG